MNIIDVILIAAVCAAVFFAVWFCIKKKRNHEGFCDGCSACRGGSCASCPGAKRDHPPI